MDGFYLADNGEYKDITTHEVIEIHELEHSTYGLIKYVVIDGMNQIVEFIPTDEYSMIPDDWMEEIP